MRYLHSLKDIVFVSKIDNHICDLSWESRTLQLHLGIKRMSGAFDVNRLEKKFSEIGGYTYIFLYHNKTYNNIINNT